MPIRIVALLAMIVLVMGEATSQTKTVVIAVMGSSTAEGAGAYPRDSSWVSRLAVAVRKDMSDNADTIVYNLALGGTTTYVGRENGFVPPPGYMGPDPERNINKALSFYPDIILVNYPSNDVANNIPTSTTMGNYQKYADMAIASNSKIYVLTTQPRTALSDAQKVQIRDQKDAIISAFPNTSINVWDLLVAPDGFNINEEVSAGDGIHVNNTGHRRIFETVSTRLFAVALPVKLTKFTAEAFDKRVDLNWETASERNNSHFVIERSSNNRDFKAIGEVKGKGNSSVKTKYSYSDKNPEPGKNFYRLKQVDLDAKTSFSQVLQVTTRSAIHNALIYPVPATNSINLKIAVEKRESILVSIFDRSGNTRGSYSRNLEKGENILNFPVQSLPTGNYLMQIRSEGSISKRSFIKL